LVFCGCQALVFLCFAIAAGFWFENQKRKLKLEAEEWARAFIESPDSETPSPLAVLIDQGATLLAARMIQQIKAMLAGVESGLSKNEQSDLLANAANQSPLLGMLGAMLPKRIRSGLMKNPQMVAALGRMVGGGNNHSPESSAGAPAPRKHRD